MNGYAASGRRRSREITDEERESDLGEWCSEHREFYTEGTPCPGCKVIREAYIRGAKDALAELYARMRQYMISSAFGPAGSFLTRLEREIDRGE